MLRSFFAHFSENGMYMIAPALSPYLRALLFGGCAAVLGAARPRSFRFAYGRSGGGSTACGLRLCIR